MIGVFDSGVGGLTVHRALTRALPQADFLYLADQANTPYGGRSPEEIIALTQSGCERLFRAGANLVLLACNTAAAIALRPLQQYWLPGYQEKTGRPVNIIGLIVPTIEAVTGLAWSEAPPAAMSAETQTIGIFATPATARSGVYETEIHKRRPHMRVVQEPCPELARLIEAGAPRQPLEEAVAGHVRKLSARVGSGPWQAILGCTHYEIIADLFTAHLPPEVRLIHQPTATADALVRYLARHPEYPPGNGGLRRFLTTGSIAQSVLAQEFWGSPLAFESPQAA